ncbi:hypothetical protein ACFL4T_10755 [candidate division KSB1 bacterium]
MKITRSVILILIALITFHCNKINGESENELLPIEGDINFSIREIHRNYNETSEPEIFISFSTEKIYPCCNYPIIFNPFKSAHHILLSLYGIEVPDMCLPALGPACGGYFLDIDNGKYNLCFRYRDIDDRYVINVSDTSIVITETEPQYTKTGYNVYWRYPPNSFAYLCGTTTETSWICENFLNSLKNAVNISEFQFPGYGQIPYPPSSAGHYYDMPAKYFYYEKENDFETAGEVLRAYSENVVIQYSGVGISLINWKNKKFLSWLFTTKE